jgi:pSer/pThr/pTyr-binding forkhead associated (FHA) protein
MHACSRCGGHTQLGFAFCQHCGAMLPTTPAAMRGNAPAMDPIAEGVAPTLAATGEEVHAPAVGSRGGERPWASLYCVRRDGSDGERYPLTAEWVEIGRADAAGADLLFDDRYLATRHARIEQQSGGGCQVVPIDLLNGVYKRLRTPVPIASGTQILLGRELLRFELVEDPERGDVAPLSRFGVTMFGSPPRAPWGRLLQVLASGGLRDVRHLHGPEVVIGREEGDIVFRDDEFLSRRHAVLRWQGNQCLLEDLKSSNGTFVRVRGPQLLDSGDTLRMGDQMFRIELGGA